MLEISNDLQVNQPTVTTIGNTFVSVENYLSILEYENDLIRVKTKAKTIKILGSYKVRSGVIEQGNASTISHP